MDVRNVKSVLATMSGLHGWMVRRVETEATTVIRLPWIIWADDGRLVRRPNPHPREVIRAPREELWLTVYSRHKRDGAWRMGESTGQLLSDDAAAVRAAAEELLAAARGQSNQVYSLVDGAARYPEVELADPEVASAGPAALLSRVHSFAEAVLAAAETQTGVEVSNLEVFLTSAVTELESSTGAHLEQPSTRADAEICLIARVGAESIAEHTARPHARRLADLDPAVYVPIYADHARAIAMAGPPPAHEGPVALTGEALRDVFALAESPISFHASARLVHEKLSRHSRGQPVTGSAEIVGEGVTLASDPLIAMGPRSQPFSPADGCPTRRVELVRDGRWHELLGARRYFDYLGLTSAGLTPPGPPGNTVLSPGSTAEQDLLADEPCAIVRALSDFRADPASGDFACEIRLGEVTGDGERRPFKGGLLIGNYFDALADVRLSRETWVLDDYHGPTVARFGHLTIAG